MTNRTRKPSPKQESTTTRWVVLFVLLSLLAHALVFLAVLLLARFVPVPKIEPPPPPPPTVHITLAPPPKPPQKPQPKDVFMPTSPQKNVTPSKNTQIISDNDTKLTSKSPTSRSQDSMMPDIVHPKSHPANLTDSPNVPAKQTSQPPAPPAQQQPKQQQQPQPPNPQPPSPQATKPTPPEPNPPKPPKPPTPQVSKITPVDNPNGLPVLPKIQAPTLAPPRTQTVVRTASPQQVQPDVASDIQGRAGMSGNPSVEARATILGKYKAAFYQAVASRWYPKIREHIQILPIGLVRIQYTVYSDGSVTTKVLEGDSPELETLLSISLNSIRETSPFKSFNDFPGLREELIRTQGDGESYTDDFSFSVYSP